MSRRAVSTKGSKSLISFFTLDRVYRALPLLFICLSLCNVYVVVTYLQREKSRLDVDKADIISTVSNVYSYVQHSLSNQIQEVRHRQLLISMPVYSSSTNRLSVVGKADSHFVTNSVLSRDTLLSRYMCDGYYSVVHGRPCVCFSGGQCYFAGDDFGYGSISRVTRLFAFCSDGVVRLSDAVRADFALSRFSVGRDDVNVNRNVGELVRHDK